MTAAHHHPTRASAWLLACWLLGTAGAALAQPAEKSAGDYTLRLSVTASMDIADSTAREHGIERSPGRAILNLTLLKQQQAGARSPVPAQVDVRVQGLYGTRHSIEMQEVRTNGYVSYFGSFVHEPREVLDFTALAQPQEGGPKIELHHRQRMGPPDTRP